MISLLRPGSPVMSEHVPAAMKRAEAQIARAFTGTYGPSLPVAERAEYQGQKYWHHAFGDVSDMGMAMEGGVTLVPEPSCANHENGA